MNRNNKDAASNGVQPKQQYRMLPLSAISPSNHQARQTFDHAALNELAASIKTHGILQPVVVAAGADGEVYNLIAGERRVRAARIAGIDKIPAMVRSSDPDSTREAALIENLQREGLTPLEEARAL